ncbi:hypothetical protein ACFWBH_34750 [Streptomyces sp. NPDC059999]|uniref:hypothetical protein n=1 Tax=Streptomyces sp. NPDC059999 TaxID=3347030 RepID=UPI0036A16AA8
MKSEQAAFSRAPLDGELWRDALTHQDSCTCRHPPQPAASTPGAPATGRPTADNRATGLVRHGMLALSTLTVVSAILTVTTN